MTYHPVSLVGAGTGEYGMMTLRGLACIQKADCIIYDNLIDPGLLSHAPECCELVYVGKAAGKHYSSQEEINQLLAEKAKAGKYVVRLKGGDPYVFGRGSEEALFLRACGLSFEIVPGVTSAVSGPAFAGIPVTHRDLARSFHVITAHTSDGGLSPESFAQIAQQEGTLVFLMGLSQTSHITIGLMAHGMAPSRPAAVISHAGTNRQRTVVSTLDRLARDVEAASLTPPALIVVGETVALRDSLCFFEERPLFGKRLLVTRAEHGDSSLSRLLSEAGAEVTTAPMIRIIPRPSALATSIKRLEHYTHILFTSSRTVDLFLDALFAAGKDGRDLAGKQLCVVGASTGSALLARGLRADLLPKTYSAAALGELLTDQLTPKDVVLLPQSSLADPALQVTLQRLCAVDAVSLYDTVLTSCAPEITAILDEAAFDAAVFTSSSAVNGFAAAVGFDRIRVNGTPAFSVGPSTSRALQRFDLDVQESNESTLASLVDKIIEYFGRGGQND